MYTDAHTLETAPQPPSSSAHSPLSSSLSTFASTLGTLYRVTLNEDAAPHRRIFIGQFIAIDPQGNLVLDRTVEFQHDPVTNNVHLESESTGTEQKSTVGRDVGMVLIPRKWWGTVEREWSFEEQMGHSLAGIKLDSGQSRTQRGRGQGQEGEEARDDAAGGCAQS